MIDGTGGGILTFNLRYCWVVLSLNMAIEEQKCQINRRDRCVNTAISGELMKICIFIMNRNCSFKLYMPILHMDFEYRPSHNIHGFSVMFT